MFGSFQMLFPQTDAGSGKPAGITYESPYFEDSHSFCEKRGNSLYGQNTFLL